MMVSKQFYLFQTIVVKKKRKTKLNLVIDGMNELKTRNLIKVIVFNCTGSEI